MKIIAQLVVSALRRHPEVLKDLIVLIRDVVEAEIQASTVAPTLNSPSKQS